MKYFKSGAGVFGFVSIPPVLSGLVGLLFAAMVSAQSPEPGRAPGQQRSPSRAELNQEVLILTQRLESERQAIQALEADAHKLRSQLEGSESLDAASADQVPGDLTANGHWLAELLFKDVSAFVNELPPEVDRETVFPLKRWRASDAFKQSDPGWFKAVFSAIQHDMTQLPITSVDQLSIKIDNTSHAAKVLRVGRVAWYAQLDAGEYRMWSVAKRRWEMVSSDYSQQIDALFSAAVSREGLMTREWELPIQLREVGL